jgi:AraC-like DNA-binding protein
MNRPADETTKVPYLSLCYVSALFRRKHGIETLAAQKEEGISTGGVMAFDDRCGAVEELPHVRHVSSRAIEDKNPTSALREFYGRELMRVDLVASDDTAPVFFDATVAEIGWATWAACEGSSFAATRDGALLSDGCDDVYLATVSAGLQVKTGREEFFVEPGGALLMSKARACRYTNPAADSTFCLLLPRVRLAMSAPHIGEAPVLNLRPGTPGLDLIFGYARMIAMNKAATPQQREKAADHFAELMAGIVRQETGSEWNGSVDPERVADARFSAIRHSIRADLTARSLSLERVARLNGISSRYVQRLFEREGDSFSDFVRRERLAHARRMLTDPRHADRRILSIAFECGFNDITTFNRAFRRAFGTTPTEARAAAVKGGR